MLLSPSPIGYAVCDRARIAGVDVDEQDPAPMAMRGATPAMEGDLGPIGGPCRVAVVPALWGMGDLADVASIRVHRENGAAATLLLKDDQTVGGSWANEAPLALVVLSSSPTLSRVSTSTGGQ